MRDVGRQDLGDDRVRELQGVDLGGARHLRDSRHRHAQRREQFERATLVQGRITLRAVEAGACGRRQRDRGFGARRRPVEVRGERIGAALGRAEAGDAGLREQLQRTRRIRQQERDDRLLCTRPLGERRDRQLREIFRGRADTDDHRVDPRISHETRHHRVDDLGLGAGHRDVGDRRAGSDVDLERREIGTQLLRRRHHFNTARAQVIDHERRGAARRRRHCDALSVSGLAALHEQRCLDQALEMVEPHDALVGEEDVERTGLADHRPGV